MKEEEGRSSSGKEEEGRTEEHRHVEERGSRTQVGVGEGVGLQHGSG